MKIASSRQAAPGSLRVASGIKTVDFFIIGYDNVINSAIVQLPCYSDASSKELLISFLDLQVLSIWSSKT